MYFCLFLWSYFRCRGRTVRVLESRPVQLALCVLMMVDAGVVIAEILLDLHAMRSKFDQSLWKDIYLNVCMQVVCTLQLTETAIQ
jgi:hypothetical protein